MHPTTAAKTFATICAKGVHSVSLTPAGSPTYSPWSSGISQIDPNLGFFPKLTVPKTGLNHALCYASVWLLSAFGLVCDRWCRTGQVSGWPPTPTPTDSGLHPPPFQPHVSFGSIHWYLLLLLLYLYLYFYFHWYVLLLVPCCNSHSWGRVIHICFRSAMRSIFQYKSDIGLNIKLDIRPFKSGQSVLTRGQCSAVQSKTAVTDVAPPSLVWVECYTETKAICNAESEHIHCIAMQTVSPAGLKQVRSGSAHRVCTPRRFYRNWTRVCRHKVSLTFCSGNILS